MRPWWTLLTVKMRPFRTKDDLIAQFLVWRKLGKLLYQSECCAHLGFLNFIHLLPTPVGIKTTRSMMNKRVANSLLALILMAISFTVYAVDPGVGIGAPGPGVARYPRVGAPGVGVLPGAGVGAPGVTPHNGIGGPASGAGALPGAGYGTAGKPVGKGPANVDGGVNRAGRR